MTVALKTECNYERRFISDLLLDPKKDVLLIYFYFIYFIKIIISKILKNSFRNC